MYPLGSAIVLKSITSKNVLFLDVGDNKNVSCVTVSKNGTYLATGHEIHGTAKVEVVIWDLAKAISSCIQGDSTARDAFLLHRLLQHHVKVQAIDFSFDEASLVTLGGQDDKDLVVWDVISGKALCGTKAANDTSYCVKWLNRRNDRFVTCGNYHFRVWQICRDTPKLHAVDANMGSIRRVMKCLSISDDDNFGFAGSETGEVLKFRIDRDDIKKPEEPDDKQPCLLGYNRKRLNKGVRAVACVINPLTGNTNIIAGAGDGMLQLMNPNLEAFPSHRAQLHGGVTSICLGSDSKTFIVGTDLSQRYSIDIKTFTPELRGSCHYSGVYDVKYPRDSSELFVTASYEDIRVWNAKNRQELLRIRIPNTTCHAIDITPSGTSIISAWSDGKIRSFLPESGKSKFIIPDAHPDEVTAITTCNDDDLNSEWRFVSGAKDGSIRVWLVTRSHRRLQHAMKEHRGPINTLTCNKDGSQVVSACSDGTCIVWDLQKGIRIHALFENAIFTDMKYHPDESQYLTCGSNCKISYWDSYDGSIIRHIDGGGAAMTCVYIQASGDSFVSGSTDKTIKLWNYDDGVTQSIGYGHSGDINSVIISPDEKSIVSVGNEGGIFIWSLPAIR